MESSVRQLRASIEDAVGSRLDNKLAMFRQTALVAATKLGNKEEELEKVEKELGKAKAEVDEKETQLSEVGTTTIEKESEDEEDRRNPCPPERITLLFVFYLCLFFFKHQQPTVNLCRANN
jgi:hypothetical protein